MYKFGSYRKLRLGLIQQLCERTMQLQLNVMDGEWTLIGDHAQAVIGGPHFAVIDLSVFA